MTQNRGPGLLHIDALHTDIIPYILTVAYAELNAPAASLQPEPRVRRLSIDSVQIATTNVLISIAGANTFDEDS